jgi:sec-independent protein translocase protein TatC
MNKYQNLSLLGHLDELRRRLIKAAIAVVIAMVISFVFADQIFQFLTAPARGYQLVYIDLTEMFGIYMSVCLAAGIFLAMPYLVYQLLMFVTPALSSSEKRYVYVVLPWVIFMFLAGAAFSYFVLLPPALKFLFSFGSNFAVPQIRIGSYVTMVSRVILATGCIFELPVVSTFLARLGIITSSWLASKRKVAVIGAFVLGAIITPTFDPINQCLVAGPLIILYEISIWLARIVNIRRSRSSGPLVRKPLTGFDILG